MITGTDEDTSIQYCSISRQVMKDPDMNLRQWFTSSPALTVIIDKMRTGSERDYAGLLGMMWNPKEDTLHFPRKAIFIPSDVRFTKRQVLSSASSTFDPVGLISSVLVPAKKFISTQWDRGFDWMKFSLANYSNSTITSPKKLKQLQHLSPHAIWTLTKLFQ